VNTLKILSGTPTEHELVAIVMAVQAFTARTEAASAESHSPEESCWALSSPFNTQRRAILHASGSPWQRSGHLNELW